LRARLRSVRGIHPDVAQRGVRAVHERCDGEDPAVQSSHRVPVESFGSVVRGPAQQNPDDRAPQRAGQFHRGCPSASLAVDCGSGLLFFFLWTGCQDREHSYEEGFLFVFYESFRSQKAKTSKHQ